MSTVKVLDSIPKGNMFHWQIKSTDSEHTSAATMYNTSLSRKSYNVVVLSEDSVDKGVGLVRMSQLLLWV